MAQLAPREMADTERESDMLFGWYVQCFSIMERNDFTGEDVPTLRNTTSASATAPAPHARRAGHRVAMVNERLDRCQVDAGIEDISGEQSPEIAQREACSTCFGSTVLSSARRLQQHARQTVVAAYVS